jgi:serpin B
MIETDRSLYPTDGGITLVSLPYKGNKLSMVWLLPRTAKGLADMEKQLSAEQLSARLTHFEKRTVELSVPRFKLEADYHLSSTLKSLGMPRAFVNPANPNGAQFDNMSQSHELFIGEVLHKTFVEVNEKGTEAAAATAVIMVDASAPPNREPPKMKPFIPVFKADHPFLFLIRDNETGSVLFLGRYLG